MNKYILFAFSRFYPSGGMNDAKLYFSTDQQLKDWVGNEELLYGYEYYQILSTHDFIVKTYFCEHDEDVMTEEDAKNELLNWFKKEFQ